MTIDLSEVSRQVRGFYNSGVTTGIACGQVAFKCLTSGTDYPVNDGSFRNLKVIMPMGRVISAVRPFPMRVWMTYPMTVIDTIFKALSPAIPDRAIAGHHADLVFPNIHGISPADGKLFIVGIGPLGGGWGAKRNEDGVSVTVCINDGDTHNSPSEQLEAKYPVLVERYSIREDSSGAGRTRGGLGAEMVVQALSAFSLTTRIDRMHCKPWGLDGGGEAAGNSIGIRRNGRWEKDLPNAKIFNVRLNRGDAYMMQSGGGGGFGDPMERDPELVAEDVREGYVSPTVAHNVYGVVLSTSGDVDVFATRLRRAAKAPVRVSTVARSDMSAGIGEDIDRDEIGYDQRNNGGDTVLHPARRDQDQQRDHWQGSEDRRQRAVIERVIDLIPHRFLPNNHVCLC